MEALDDPNMTPTLLRIWNALPRESRWIVTVPGTVDESDLTLDQSVHGFVFVRD